MTQTSLFDKTTVRIKLYQSIWPVRKIFTSLSNALQKRTCMIMAYDRMSHYISTRSILAFKMSQFQTLYVFDMNPHY